MVAEEEAGAARGDREAVDEEDLVDAGHLALASVSLASSLMPMIVPMASKKHDSSTVKTKRTPVSTPTWRSRRTG